MARSVWIANTNLEYEFASSFRDSLRQGLSRHPFFLQLQFLPLLYAHPEDFVAVTAFPEPDYLSFLRNQLDWWPQGLPTLIVLEEASILRGACCLPWGPSQQVKEWSHTFGLDYRAPEETTTKLINSKAFSFRYTTLSSAKLINSEEELRGWLSEIKGPKVLKTSFGLSGQGNFRVNEDFPSPALLSFCQKEWKLNRSIIGEPWLNRLYDFSTQWLIHPNQQIELRGATRFQVDAKGNYLGTLAGSSELLFPSSQSILKEHCHYVEKALKEMAQLGFYGPVGIDAFVYRCPNTHKDLLNPLVEINGRETMSLVALRLQQKLCPDRVLRLSFQNSSLEELSLLPHQLFSTPIKKEVFRRRLQVEITTNIQKLI